MKIKYHNPFYIYIRYKLPDLINTLKKKLGYSEIYIETNDRGTIARRLYSGWFIRSTPPYKQ